MDKGEIIKQLREQNEQLKRENELLKAKIRELEARLAQYENAHTPPSLRRGRNRKKDKGKPGQKIGHKGLARPYAAPNNQVEVTADRCPDCGSELGTLSELSPDRSSDAEIQRNNRMRPVETLCQIHKSHSSMLGTPT